MTRPDLDDYEDDEEELVSSDMPPQPLRAASKLILSVLFILILAAAISRTNDDAWLTAWMIGFVFLGIPVFILCWMELGTELRAIENPGWLLRLLGMLFGVPQLLFGLIALAIGLAITGWVLFNVFIERQPEYTGGYRLGVAPALIIAAWYWIRAAFSKAEMPEDDDSYRIEGE